jgi:Family of unknown function (DUF5988)
MDPIDDCRDDSRRNEHQTIHVILEGGPSYLPTEMRLHRSILADRKVKVPCRGGYEHFELTDDDRLRTDGSAVFRWTFRTKVAE